MGWEMHFRKFEQADAEFCFKVRNAAFIKLFYDEIGADIVTLCVNAYMPSDYIKMSDEMEIFIAENNNLPVGFLTIKRTDQTHAEIPLIYFDLNHTGKGIGTISIKFIENWIVTNWKEVDILWLDTIIPKYNSGFYKKVGFTESGKSECEFNGLKVPSVRFSKKLK